MSNGGDYRFTGQQQWAQQQQQAWSQQRDQADWARQQQFQEMQRRRQQEQMAQQQAYGGGSNFTAQDMVGNIQAQQRQSAHNGAVAFATGLVAAGFFDWLAQGRARRRAQQQTQEQQRLAQEERRLQTQKANDTPLSQAQRLHEQRQQTVEPLVEQPVAQSTARAWIRMLATLFFITVGFIILVNVVQAIF